jgi:cytochrome c5
VKNSQLFFIGLLLILSGVLGFWFSWHHHMEEPAVASEAAIPIIHNPVNFLCQLEHDPQAGKKIFKMFCASCHGPDPLVDIHAPLIGDIKAWRYRRHSGMEALLRITIEGRKAMPARGGCFECSDKQLRQAIQYMLDGSKS